MSTYDSGSIAWVMASSISIMLMSPGIGLFYGGLANKKNLLSIISFSFLIFSISSLTWALVGFSLAFGQPTLASGFIGDCTYCGIRYISDTVSNRFSSNITFPTYFFLQMVYAGIAGVIVITPFVGRLRTIYLTLIAISYQLIIYSPITHWIRTSNGWMNKIGIIDFSGGAMVHLTSGFGALGMLYMLGPATDQMQIQNSTSTFSTLIGTIFIWFSSFGFNGAAALTSDTPAAASLINTQLAAAGGAIGWTFTQYIFTDRAKVNGWCSGIVCGVISITPCSGFVSLWSSAVIGAISSIIVYIFCHLKSQSLKQLPDTLGIFSGHGITAFWGIICTGAFATRQSGSSYQGLFYGGEVGWRLFGLQIVCALVCSIYAFVVMTFIHFLMLRLVEPHLTEEQKQQGLDTYSHIRQNDPLDEDDIINIIKTLNSYNQLNKMMQSNNLTDQVEPPQLIYEGPKIIKNAKDRKKNLKEPPPSKQVLMEKLRKLDKQKQKEMYKHYKKTLKLKQKESMKSSI